MKCNSKPIILGFVTFR